MNTYNKYQKAYYERHKESIREKAKASYYSRIETKHKYRRENVARTLFDKSKSRAQKTGLEHSISVEDIVIPTHCPYLGFQITNIQGKGLVTSNPSLDRIDNSRGYTKDNIQIISYLANKMKNNATEEQLIAFAKGVLRIHDRASSNQVSS